MGERFVQRETLSGAPVSVGDVIVTPQSQALTIRLPFGGFVWNRPMAVRVQQNGEEEVIPIVDVTRQSILGLGAIGALVLVIMGLMALSKKKSSR